MLGSCPGKAYCFRFSLQNNCSDLNSLFVRIDTYQSEPSYSRRWVVQHAVPLPCVFQVDVSNLGKPLCTFFSCAIFFFLDIFWFVRHNVFTVCGSRNRLAVGFAPFFSFLFFR